MRHTRGLALASRLAILALLLVVLPACGSGSDGTAGAPGTPGTPGTPGISIPVIQSLSTTGLPATPGASVTVQVSAQSPDGLLLTYAWGVTPATWLVTAGAGTSTLTLTAPGAYAASGSATVTVTDTNGRVATGLVSLSTVGNSGPVIHSVVAAPNPANNGESAVATVFATDPNGDSLSYLWTVPGLGLTLTAGQGTNQISIATSAFASGLLSVTVSDGLGASATGAVFLSTWPGAWGLSQAAESFNVEARYPQVVSDANGTSTVVWFQENGPRYDIWANRRPAGGSWETPTLLETDDAGVALSPQVTVDTAGNVTAAWFQNDGVRHNIVANRYSGGAWGSAQLIESDNAGNAQEPQLACDSSGAVFAVWYQGDGVRDNIWANRYSGGSWGTAQLIESDNAGHARVPHVVVDASGTATAVWHQSDGLRLNIWANRFVAGTWGTAQLIEADNTGDAQDSQVAVDGSGIVTAVWKQFDGTRFNVWANRCSGGIWGTAQLIETDNLSNAHFPEVTAESNGTVTAVWEQSDGVRSNIWANRFQAGAWGTAQLIETLNAGDASYPHVVSDAGGNVTVAWHQSDGSRHNIWSIRHNGSSWGTPQLIEFDNVGGALHARLASDGLGRITAVWFQSDGTRNSIGSNRFE